MNKRLNKTCIYSVGSLAALALVFLIHGCTHNGPNPELYGTPQNAVDALVAAARAHDVAALKAIMGEGSEDILSSGDDVADQNNRAKFLSLYDEKHSLSFDKPTVATLIIGKNDWPFPIPLVFEEGKWSFDAEAGREEIINRRVGENELSAIQVCKAIGDAQKEYALRDPEGTGKHPYARKFASDEGKKNGLYWPAAEGQKPSPLGELAAAASAEGYRKKEQGPTAYHGYYYRLLEAQGPDAPDGEVDFVVDGYMTLGFAVVAYPADYGNSGIMTFIMDDAGVVYQKDLGEETEKFATEMKTFNPDSTWKKAE